MYKCFECGTLFDLNDEHEELIGSCLKKEHPVSIIVKCPECGWKHVAGGEPDFYEDENDELKPCIMMYGYDYENSIRRQDEVNYGWHVREGYERAGKKVERIS